MLDQTDGDIALNVERLGHLDIPGGGQVVVQGDYAYVGHMKPPLGTSIIDISNSAEPRIVAQLQTDSEYSHTHKVRVAGDIMITNVEMNNRHFLRVGDRIPGTIAQLESDGVEPSDAIVAAALGVKESDLPILYAARERGYADGGFKVWDISDKTAPKLLSYVHTHGFGTHRFDMDENYAYISTEVEGYIGNILVTYDLSDPSHPQEVSRWWMPGQHLAGGEVPTWTRYQNRLHHALRVGDEMWASVWHAGFRIINVSDISKPTTVAEHNYHPMIKEPTHTILPVPHLIDGRRIAVVIDEEHKRAPGPGQAPANLWVFDVTNYDNIHGLSSFHVPEWMSPWATVPGGRFGAHQFQDHMEDTLVYCTWFSGGLRIVDVADPFNPTEVGHFIPQPADGFASPQSNDVEVGHNGLIYLLDRDSGFDILAFNR